MFHTHLTQEKEQIFELVFLPMQGDKAKTYRCTARLINDEVAENSTKMFVLFG